MLVSTGDWVTHSLELIATSDMPLGEPLIVELHNLATTDGNQINLDNIKMKTSGTSITQPINDEFKFRYEKIQMSCLGITCSATSPTGKNVIGGGCWTSNGSYGAIQNNVPSGGRTDQWHCRINGQFESTVAVAICANIH